jgi:tetratricopeptide (TPR) repeat protein
MKKFAAISLTTVLLIIGFFAVDIASQVKKDLTSAFNESIDLETAGKTKEAIAVLDEFYPANKTNYLLNLRLGYLNYQDSAYTKSTTYYESALKVKPNSIEARLGLRLPYAKINKWAEIEELYNQILKLDPNNKEANLRMGQIYYYKGLDKFSTSFLKAKPDWEKSKVYLEKVLNPYPSDYETNLAYGYTSLALGNNDLARESFKNVLMVSKGDTVAIKGLGYIK